MRLMRRKIFIPQNYNYHLLEYLNSNEVAVLIERWNIT